MRRKKRKQKSKATKYATGFLLISTLLSLVLFSIILKETTLFTSTNLSGRVAPTYLTTLSITSTKTLLPAQHPTLLIPTLPIPTLTPTLTLTTTPLPSPTPPYPIGEAFSIGKSVAKRDIEVYRFGTGPEMRMVIAGIHGGYEWNTSALAYELIKDFSFAKTVVK